MRESEQIMQEREINLQRMFVCLCVIDRNSNRIVDFSRDIGYLGFDRSRSLFVVCLYEKIIIIYIKKHNSIIVCSLWLNYN